MAVDGDMIDFPTFGRLELGPLFAHGANSSLFTVKNKPDLVVKAHHFRARNDRQLDVSFSSETSLKLQGDGICAPLEWTVVHDEDRDKGQLTVLFTFLDQYIHLEEALSNIEVYSEQERFLLAKHLCRLVFDVHAQGWLHGDLQPRNIMFHPKTLDVQLIDFEWALPKNHGNKDDTRYGVDDWMAPELLAFGRRAHSQASEVWTLGKIVLSLLTIEARTKNREFRKNGNLNSIHDNILQKGEDSPLFSFEPEGEYLSSLFLKLASATIPKIEARPELSLILEEFDLIDLNALHRSKFSPSILEVLCPPSPTTFRVTNGDFEIGFYDSHGTKRNVRLGRTKKFKVEPLDIEINIILDSPSEPRIQIDGSMYPLTEGITVQSSQGTWSISKIEVLR